MLLIFVQDTSDKGFDPDTMGKDTLSEPLMGEDNNLATTTRHRDQVSLILNLVHNDFAKYAKTLKCSSVNLAELANKSCDDRHCNNSNFFLLSDPHQKKYYKT